MFLHLGDNWKLILQRTPEASGSNITPTGNEFLCPPESTLDLSIPQTVDQGLQHGVEKTIKQEKDLLLLFRVLGFGSHLHDNGPAKEEPDHTEV